jgi:site-specific DNA-methyltransferase (adenine-specific)
LRKVFGSELTNGRTENGTHMEELQLIDVAILDSHPKNPRVVLRQDIIDAIASQLAESGYQQKNAIHVRPLNGRMQVISGHHRTEAAKKAGLDSVWCWVEEMDDDSAFMALVTSNAQGELDPLEIGIHAFEAVPEGKRGRGNKGDGLTAYAAKIGQKQPNVSNYRNAGEVVSKIICQHMNLSDFLEKAQHLNAIHKLPQEAWQVACEWLAGSSCSLSDCKAFVDRVLSTVEHCNDDWFPVSLVVSKLLETPDFSASTIKKLLALAEVVLLDCVGEFDSLKTDFQLWCIENAGGDSWNLRKVEAKLAEIKQAIASSQVAVESSWFHGDWKDYIDAIENESINLLLTDPPYGMDYRSGRRKDKHSLIENDGDIGDACDVLRSCVNALLPKLCKDAHILVFCRWDSDGAFQAALRNCGLTVKSSLIWVKDNHGAGDLKGGFAPKHERIIHAIKGTPSLFVREPDVLECAKVATDIHPTEKPVDLLARLIEATTVEGQFVFDPFGGVASTLVAAKRCGRKWAGCEISEEYYKGGARRLGGKS